MVSLWCVVQAVFCVVLVEKRPAIYVVLVSFLLNAGLLGVNTFYFPQSQFSIIYPDFFYSAMVLICLVFSFLLLRKLLVKTTFIYIALFTLSLVVFVLLNFSALPSKADFSRRPDIFIVGVDSLRPDHLGLGVTPNLDLFLRSGRVYSNAYTAMARTYPSWMSILTGRYPAESGVRFNLMTPDSILKSDMAIQQKLKDVGYFRLYAIDETRFSNIDASYGFDEAVTPEIGASEFIITELADNPLVNLLSLFEFSKYLVPARFINRASSVSYDPSTFISAVQNALQEVPQGKPLFMAIHFELPHWPFEWRDSKKYAVDLPVSLLKKSPASYQLAVSRADKQFGELMASLESSGRLENALVVVISDHGEGFFQFAPEWKNVGSDVVSLPPFSWHGLNVLDTQQTQVLLGFRTFGRVPAISLGVDNRLASLIDVAPTILSHLGIETDLPLSGKNILAAGQGESDRYVYTESGFFVPSLLQKVKLDTGKMAEEALPYYNLTKEGRLVIKDEVIDKLLMIKQRAVTDGRYMLATMPSASSDQLVWADLKLHHYRLVHKQELIENLKIKEFEKAYCKLYANDSEYSREICHYSIDN